MLALFAAAIGTTAFNNLGPEDLAKATLAKMTIDEKLSMLGGVDGFYVPAVPRLGLPRVKMSDGPMGVRNYGKATNFPAGTAIAATWNPVLAHAMGEGIGREARARDVGIWLGPGVNLARIPQNGRNFEYGGEDPLLAGTLASQIIRGVQAHGVSATIKHYVANDHESDRNNDNSVVDERTLHELQLRPFELAVKDGEVGALMTGYNLVNGPHMSEHDALVNGVLKKDWGFQGVVMSDWVSTYSTAGAVNGGLDLEMPSAEWMTAAKIKPLLESGTVKMATIDDKVLRILRLGFRFGMYSRPQLVDITTAPDPESEKTARQIALEGTVLLKNNGVLPLKAGSVVVTGPNADGLAQGGGSSYTEGWQKVSLQLALSAAPKGVQVAIIPSVVDYFTEKQIPFDGPLKAEWFDNRSLLGGPVKVTEEALIRHNWRLAAAPAVGKADEFSVRWTGTVTSKESVGAQLAVRSDDGVRVYVDGRTVLDKWNERGAATDVVPVTLTAGKTAKIVVEYFEAAGEAIIQVGLSAGNSSFSQPAIGDAVRKAKAVVVAVGLNSGLEAEGFDHAFEMPADQNQLILDLVRLNRNVVVVNYSGAALDVSPWIDRVGAFVQAWYPGQNGNEAVADLLYGRENFSGKLPVTWPRSLKGSYYETAYPSFNREIVYREGINMGYRGVGTTVQTPLFAFGSGLSYSLFRLENARRSGDTITVDVTNKGKIAGAETVQVYAEYEGDLPMPSRALAGFAKVKLGPGVKKMVTVSLDPRLKQYWDVATHGWRPYPGKITYRVGNASDQLPLSVNQAG